MYLAKIKWAVVVVALLLGVSGGVWAWQGSGSQQSNTEQAGATPVRQPNDYDRLEGIWRKETRNPVTDELDLVEELIFKKNQFVRRRYSKVRGTMQMRFLDHLPQRFELHQTKNPKGIDLNLRTTAEAEKEIEPLLKEASQYVRELNLSGRNLHERDLGIYELTSRELKLFMSGYIPFEVQGNRLVPNPNAPQAKRPISFAQAGNQLQVYRRVERSFKDQMNPAGADPAVASAPGKAEDPQAANPAPSNRLQELLRRRLELAEERLAIAKAAAAAGNTPPSVVMDLELDVIKAKMALGNKAEKIRLLEQQLRVLQEKLEQVQSQYAGGQVPKSRVISVRQEILEVEIQLEELKGKP